MKSTILNLVGLSFALASAGSISLAVASPVEHDVRESMVRPDFSIVPNLPNQVEGEVQHTIRGWVMTGANPCEAEGRHARLRLEKRSFVVHVIPESFGRSSNRLCTREYNPVFEASSVTVALNRPEVLDAILQNVGVDLHSESISAVVEGMVSEPTTTNSLRMEDVNSENGEGLTLLRGVIMSGFNGCNAYRSAVSFRTRVDADGVTHFVPTKHLIDPFRVCTMEYMPVFEDAVYSLPRDSSLLKNAVVDNVGEVGKSVPFTEIESFMR